MIRYLPFEGKGTCRYKVDRSGCFVDEIKLDELKEISHINSNTMQYSFLLRK